MTLEVKIKKLHPDAVVPKYAKPGDAGMDLVAVSEEYDENRCKIKYGTGLAFEIPQGYVGLVFPRSSIHKTGLTLTNSVGVVDSGYRGEVMFFFEHLYDRPKYNIGDRIGQIMIIPHPEIKLKEVKELSNSDRGNGGFGSTGS